MTSRLWKCAAACVCVVVLDCAATGAAVRQAEDAVQQPYAKLVPPLESIALPSERAVFDAFMAEIRQPSKKPAEVLAAADEALSQLHSPTKLRGFVQLVRAEAFAAMSRDLDAIDAAQESVQLLPGYSAPLLIAFTSNAYLNRTAEATEYLIRMIDTDPTTARTIDDYEIRNLLRRLHSFDDEARVRAISDRLLQIGWIGNHLDSRSSLAVEAIRSHIAESDVTGARSLVPRLLNPDDSRALLIDKTTEAVWPDVEAWAGPRLDRQWPMYLHEARQRWVAGKTSISAHDYLNALVSAGRYDTAVAEILPVLERPKEEDWELMFMMAPMAKTLAKLGRWKDAERLYEHAQQVWPLGSQANALNISANYSILLLEEGRANAALERIDASLADARKWGPEASEQAFAGMQHQRACVLHALGRDSEAAASVAQALAVERGSAAAMLHLCMGHRAAAKEALADALRSEATRGGVLEFMQPPSGDPWPGDYGRRERASIDELRSDPDLLEAVERYGRVLPWRLNDAANSAAPMVSAH